jgi:hypothetical protein
MAFLYNNIYRKDRPASKGESTKKKLFIPQSPMWKNTGLLFHQHFLKLLPGTKYCSGILQQYAD